MACLTAVLSILHRAASSDWEQQSHADYPSVKDQQQGAIPTRALQICA